MRIRVDVEIFGSAQKKKNNNKKSADSKVSGYVRTSLRGMAVLVGRVR